MQIQNSKFKILLSIFLICWICKIIPLQKKSSLNFNAIDKFFCERLAESINDIHILKKNVSINVSKNINLSFEFFIIGNGILDHVSEYIRRTGSWEMHHIKTIFAHLEKFRVEYNLKKKDVTFIDIGSNIGWFSVIFARLGYSVISFEPMPYNEIILRKNKCLFEKYKTKLGMENTWTILNIGLSNITSQCKIYNRASNFGNGVISCSEHDVQNLNYQAEVKVRRLDDILSEIGNINVGMLKMDTEGHEIFVLRGGLKFFEKVKSFLGEINSENDNSDLKSKEFVALLGQLKYKLGSTIMIEEKINLNLNNQDFYAWRY